MFILLIYSINLINETPFNVYFCPHTSCAVQNTRKTEQSRRNETSPLVQLTEVEAAEVNLQCVKRAAGLLFWHVSLWLSVVRSQWGGDEKASGTNGPEPAFI